jgi:coenzyme Q-binding protein COQ10
MFDLVMDVRAYPDFLPWCQGAQVLHKTDTLMIADLSVGVGDMKKTYRSRIFFKEPQEIMVTQESGPFKVLKNSWHFLERPEDPHSCQIDFAIEFSFQSGILNTLMSHVFDKAARKMVSSFEERAQTLYGKKGPIHDYI